MSSFLSGVTIGPYEVIHRLHRGGMADVYLVRNQDHPERGPVVVRLIESQGGDADALEAERLGARLQKSLSRVDARVPHIHAYGDLEEGFFVEMEYVEGEDLADRLHDGHQMPLDEALHVARELLDVLVNAHGHTAQIDGREVRGIVHGDIKAKNVRLQPDGAVRILDFGIARALTMTRKQTKNMFASTAYAPPERLASGTVDEHSDLWAVAVLLYEMLSGRLPFHAETEEHLERLIQTGEGLEPLSERVCPRPVWAVLQRALAHDPARRFPSAAAFRDALDAAARGEMPDLPDKVGVETERTKPKAAGVVTERTKPKATGLETHRSGGEPRDTRPGGPSLPGDGAGAPLVATPPVAMPGAAAGLGEPPPPPPARRRRERPPARPQGRMERFLTRAGKAVLLLILVAVLGVAVVEAALWSRGTTLRDDLLAGTVSVDEAWTRYQDLARLSPTDLAVQPARFPLRDALVAETDRVIGSYRNSDDPEVREGDWELAKERLQRATALGGVAVEARLAYVEGQLDRINGRGRDAVTRFRRAARLQPRWPDPHLGLANVYLYTLRDYAEAEKTLDKLEEMGFPMGKREQAQRADAAFFQGLDRLKECEPMEPGDALRDCLVAARDHLTKAVERYEPIASWGRSTQNMRHARQQLSEIDVRLAELQDERWQDRLRWLFEW